MACSLACAPSCKSCTTNGPAKCDTCNDGYVLTTSDTCAGQKLTCTNSKQTDAKH